MEYVKLGWTDIKISKIGLGTWQFSAAWGVTEYGRAKAIIAKAYEVGINFFDTAMVYGRGMSEEFLGKALKELSIKRDEVVIATKIPGEYLSPDDVFKSVERSLKRLGVEYVDLMQIHWPPCWHHHPTCKYARALERLVYHGKIRYVGVSNYPVELVEELRSCFSTIDIVSMQYRYNLVERQAEIELIPYAEANDLTFFAWSPIAKGALTGKYSIENLPRFNDVRGEDPLFHPENFRQIQPVIELLKRLGAKYGKKPVQVALNWIMSYSPVIVPIPGAKSPQQVEENAKSVEWRLSYEDWRSLDELSRKVRISYAIWYLE
ncbi:MAG: aldo/keto reductase [Thermoprotei archaeon]|nr:MAG: aldo/keto reductase [Thermoprotei archaeon]